MDLRTYYKEETKKAEKKQEQVDRDPNRLALHLMPPVGWLNDPNGLCQFHGEYHVFYQYSPLDANGSMKAWGHYASKDLIHWEQLDVAFFPDQKFDRDGVYSGSAFLKDDRMYLYYTGNVKEPGDVDLTYEGRQANTVLVTSDDGRIFSEKELLMTNADYPDSYTCHIRDPKVWEQDGCYYMVQGGRKMMVPEAGADGNFESTDYGTVLIFQSKDLHHWQFLKDVTTKERFGYMWECPDYFMVDGQHVLSVSPQGLSSEKFRFQNVYQSGYFLLDQEILDGEPDAAAFHEWDMGFDFYAPQTFCDERGRRILIGWAGIGDAEYDNEPTVRQGWQHCLTLPRQIIYRDGKLLQQPLEELKELRGPQISIHAQTSTVKPVFELELKAFKEDWFAGIGTGADALMLRYKDGILSFRITGEAGRGRTSREIKIDNVKNVRMIVDTSIVEIYVNDGETVITSRFYFRDSNRNIETRGIETVNMWYLKGLEVKRA